MMERIYYLEKGGRENYGENKKSRKKYIENGEN